ncbi:TPA: hypothetical protein JBB31_10430 [Legionella pneumophila subsp. pneumophila]|nr:hypothetical protein [Legionella pneumophila]HAT9089981.1 hypothetical protein [Legionella pneumophila subsp. pneumophila]HDV5685163.1 hypothetical protein [Legionella pneumophila]HDV5843293.1 hypothetical protein [Legionella pneumophila]HDV5849225.1 hypothetical protein [Legionella pneumophila]
MLLKYLFTVTILITSSIVFAQLPKEVIDSCHDGVADNRDSVIYMYLPNDLRRLAPRSITPVKNDVEHIELGGSYDYEEINGSEERYQFDFFMHHFSIEDNQYFVRSDSRTKLSDAINHSNHSIAQPGNINNLMTVGKITFNKKEYLCISGPLYQNGTFAAVAEYYIVENAFDYDKKIQLHYYFFDREFVEMALIRDNGDGHWED